MDVLFVGTAEFGSPSLDALVQSKRHRPVGVITQPDRPSGRGMEERISPIKERALHYNLPISQPEDINSGGAKDWIESLAPDAYLVVAYGQIVSPIILRLVRFPVNIHGSLLPDYRGAAPVNWAIINGEETTGVTSMLMDRGMDTGPILLQREISVGPCETAGEVHDRLSELGGEIVLPTLDRLEIGALPPRPQPREGSLAPKLSREDGKIDWGDPPERIHNQVRGMNPWPGAYTRFRDRSVKIHETRLDSHLSDVETAGEPGRVRGFTKEGILVEAGGGEVIEVRKVQPESKQKMNGREFCNGYRVSEGDRFGS